MLRLTSFLDGSDMGKSYRRTGNTEPATQIPATYHKALGEVTARGSGVMFYVQSFIWHCLSVGPKEGRLLTTRTGAQQLLATFGGLRLRWIEPSDEQEIKDIVKLIRKLNTTRNTYVHGMWAAKTRSKELVFIGFSDNSSRVDPKTQVHPLAELRCLAKKYRQAESRLRRLHQKYDAPLP